MQIILLYLDDLISVSNEEYSVIIASLKYVYEERYDCHNPAKYNKKKAGRWLNQEDVDNIRKVNNCFTPAKIKDDADTTHDHIDFYLCPCNFYTPQIEELIHISQYYVKHLKLPDEYINIYHPLYAKTIQVITIINNFINVHEQKMIQKKNEELERKLKLKGKK